MDRRKRSTAEAHPPELSADIVLFQILPRLPVKSIFRFRCVSKQWLSFLTRLPVKSVDIVLFQILPRLPVKSVLRFRSVSKQWHSFLTSPDFVKMHLHHANITNNNKIVVVSSKTSNTFRTIDCERPNDGFTYGHHFPFKVGPDQCILILTSVHGLLCIGIIRKNEMYADCSDLIMWNPATGDYKTLSKPVAFSHQKDCYKTAESLFGLYHSSCDQDYKLLRVTRDPNIVYIYSLKSDSWRRVESGLQCDRTRRMGKSLPLSWGASVWLNENLYFLEHVFDTPCSIMRFNTKTETLKVIATPFSGDKRRRTTWLSFTVDRNGCIELWVNTEKPGTLSSENELWRMDGDGDWTKMENSCTIMNDRISYYHRLHLMRKGYLLGYDSYEGCVNQIHMKTNTQNVYSYITEKMLVWPGVKYIGTLVSPNQYAK